MGCIIVMTCFCIVSVLHFKVPCRVLFIDNQICSAKEELCNPNLLAHVMYTGLQYGILRSKFFQRLSALGNFFVRNFIRIFFSGTSWAHISHLSTILEDAREFISAVGQGALGANSNRQSSSLVGSIISRNVSLR